MNNTLEVQDGSQKKLFPFMQLKAFFIGLSVVLVCVSLYFIFSKGLNFGVDFKGGTKLIYQFNKQLSDGEIREILSPLSMGDVQVVLFGQPKDNSFMIKVKEIEGRNLSKEINQTFGEKLGGASFTVLSEEIVGPKVGADLRKRGLLSLIVTCSLILIYVGIRFDFLFAPGAVIALFHDVIVAAGFFAFFGKEFNLPILAALLTIIGYSVNDTIIIYDRIRENVAKLDQKIKLEDLINISVNQTLSRTIVTSLTVLFVVVILYFFGGAILEDFAFCLIIGVVAGSYSTIFVASPIYMIMQKLLPHKGMASLRKI